MVWIEDAGAGAAIAWNRRGKRAGARHVANVRLEVLDFVEDGRVVEDSLIVLVVGIEGPVERHRFARTGVEDPDDPIGEPFEVAAGAVLPAGL